MFTGWQLREMIGKSFVQDVIIPMMDIFVLAFEKDETLRQHIQESAQYGMIGMVSDLLDSLIFTVNEREKIMPINKMSIKIQKQYYRIASRVRAFRIVHRNKINETIIDANIKQSGAGAIKANEKVQDSNISKPFLDKMNKFINAIEKTRKLYNPTSK